MPYKEWEAPGLPEETKMVIRLAYQVSEDEYVQWVETNDCPPVELSESDMAVLSGGGPVDPPRINQQIGMPPPPDDVLRQNNE